MFHRLRVVALVLLTLVSLLVWSNFTQAAEVTFLRVQCDLTLVRGKTEIRAPFLRITVHLASDLTVMLAEKVVRVNRHVGSRFSAELAYPLQAEGTRLIIAVGEWDGRRYMKPAALFGRDCFDPNATPPPTPTPPIASPTLPPTDETPPPTPFPTFTPTFLPPTYPPPVTPTMIVTPTAWQVNSTLLEDSCGVGEDNQTFPATLVLAEDGTVLSLSALELNFPLTNVGNGAYFSQFTVGEVSYTLNLQFLSSDTFAAAFSFTLESVPGCTTSYSWAGMNVG